MATIGEIPREDSVSVSVSHRRRRLRQRLATPEAGDGEDGRYELVHLVEGGGRGRSERTRRVEHDLIVLPELLDKPAGLLITIRSRSPP